MSTLNYLDSVPLPILIHYYHKPSDTGYWMWLGPFYAENYRSDWERKEKVRVYIPTRNILDKKAVDKIAKYVMQHYRKQYLLKKSLTETEVDPNYNWIFENNEQGFRITVRAKHNEAGECHPIKFYMPLDSKAQESFQKSIETGEASTFGTMLTFEGLPDWFLGPIEGKKMEVTVRPHVPSQQMSVQMDFLDGSDCSLLRIESLEFRVERLGTISGRWWARLPSKGAMFALELDKSTKTIHIKVEPDPGISHPIALSEFYDMLETLQSTTKVKITSLQTFKQFLLDGEKLFPVRLTENQEMVRRLARALSVICKAMSISISMPSSFQYDEVVKAERVADVISKGESKNWLDFSDGVTVTITIFVIDIERILTEFKEESRLRLEIPGEQVGLETKVNILGHELDLGPAEAVFENVRATNWKEIMNHLVGQEAEEEVEIKITVDIDPDNAYVRFEDWPKP